MSFREVIEAGLDSAPDCIALSYIDMRARLVLNSASRTPLPQELLDRVANVSARLFLGPAFGTAGTTSEKADQAAILGSRHIYLFQRMQTLPDHAFCLLCERGADAAGLRRHALSLRARLAHAL
ncbi:hypothetical protein OEZ60_07710 [Defluviimonas sp. WL0024]|uniref:Uncharacterized protein n=1 Tax=Albidovulum salinarum TaxID=2984153 RepID=A0ABT2X1S0_9RHOB|nr:hypothetical protein [Defluviimonas sp. WL0024]MCU9847891.1 hypothetical protein [Defluviimonas sp. WL0024]